MNTVDQFVNSNDVGMLGAMVGGGILLCVIMLIIISKVRRNSQIRGIAIRLGIRDKGLVGECFVKSESGGEYSKHLIHTLCGARMRIGVMNESGEPAHWCHVCEKVFSDRSSGGGGNYNNPDNPPSPNIIDITTKLQQRVR